MKKIIQVMLCVAVAIQVAHHTFGQANTSLSNLISTSVNQSLIPNANNTLNVGSSANSWQDVYFDGNIFIDDKRYISNKGTGNTFIGSEAGLSNTGTGNTVAGHQAGFNNISGDRNAFMGWKAGYKNSSADGNVFVGYVAGYTNTENFNLVFIGDSAGFENGGQAGDPGDNNTFIGNSAGQHNDASARNTFIGSYAGYKHSIESNNTFVGYSAGKSHSEGGDNTIVGSYAGFSAGSGYKNSFFGTNAGYNTLGGSNSFFGHSAGYNNLGGTNNCYIGYQAAYTSSSGNYNVAIGDLAFYDNQTGSSNTAVGPNALWNNTTGSGNVAVGQYACNNNSTGSYNVAIGWWASPGSSYTNTSSIGYFASSSASNQVRLGNSSVTSIGGYAGWSNISDGRYKKNIKDEVHGLDFIVKLRPITYNLDITGIENHLHGNQQMADEAMNPLNEPLMKEAIGEKEKLVYSGFIAQEVENAAKEIGYDFSGVDAPKNEDDLYGLRYGEFVVPLVKAVQELDKENKILNSKNEILEQRIAKLESEISRLNEGVVDTKYDAIEDFPKFAIDPDGSESQSAILGQNIPNPFNNFTLIPFYLPKDCQDASIVISKSHSQEIVRVIPVKCTETQIKVDARMFASGSYSYSLVVDGTIVNSKTMILIR